MATITDVARLAGVSIATVSHVINGTKYVGPGQVDKVNKAIRELGYKTNEMAASMKRRHTMNIGVILPNIRMVFFPEVLEGIEAAATEKGYKLFYYSTEYDFEKEKEYLNQLKSSWVDGIVIDSCCASDNIEEYQKVLIGDPTEKKVPVVALETPFSAEELGVILFDQVKYTTEALEYLISIGRKKIGLITGPDLPVYRDTMTACRKVFRKHGISFRKASVMHGDYFTESGYILASQALENGADWDAVFAENDQMAIGAMKAIREAGKRIPEDIAVIGADGVFVTSLINPSLTTIDLPRYEMGYRSVEMLVDMIRNHPDKGEKLVLDGKLIIRQSTDSSVKENWGVKGW